MESEFNPETFEEELKKLGEQIESIARSVKKELNHGDIDLLYELGYKVEHFCDHIDFSTTPSNLSSDAQSNDRRSSEQNTLM